MQVTLPPETSDCTSDLSQWYHCSNNRGLPDTVISKAWEISEKVSFIFHHRSNSAVAEAKIAEEVKIKKRQKELEDEEEEKENACQKKSKTILISDDDEDYDADPEDMEEAANSDDDWVA